MNEITLFSNPEFGEIRTVDMSGEPWFVLKDVCAVLEIKNHKDVVTRLEDDEKGVALIDTLGGAQNMTIINESGLYAVILRSDKPQAKPFRKWLTNEVVPSIRKSGSYSVSQSNCAFSDLSPQLQTLINLEIRQKQQEQAIAETNKRIDHISEIVSLDSNSWRNDSRHIVTQIAISYGGYEHTKDVYNQIYELVDKRAGVSLSTRLKNKQQRMALEGVSKSKINKITVIDIIGEDKKLIEIYLAIVKELAVKSGITCPALSPESA